MRRDALRRRAIFAQNTFFYSEQHRMTCHSRRRLPCWQDLTWCHVTSWGLVMTCIIWTRLKSNTWIVNSKYTVTCMEKHTVEPLIRTLPIVDTYLITDIPNSGHLPNNGQESVHQPYFPQYNTNLTRVDMSLLWTTDSCVCTNKQQSIQFHFY